MDDFENIQKFYETFIKIEQIKRAGWVMRNVPSDRLESVGDHTLQTILLSSVIIRELNLDIDLNKLTQMLLIHDIGEIIIDDIPEVDERHKNKKRIELDAVKECLSSLSNDTNNYYLDLWLEMEERKTPLANFAYQIDKLDAVMKSNVYSKQYKTPELFEEFYEHEKNKKTFDNSKIKELFKFVKGDYNYKKN